MLRFLIAFVLTVSGASALGQTYTVHATDPAADFSSLYDAIQAVPDNATLTVLSDLFESDFTPLDRPLSIIGGDGVGTGSDGRPRVRGLLFLISSHVRVRGVEISSTGGHSVDCYPGARALFSQCTLDADPESDCVVIETDAIFTCTETLIRTDGWDGTYFNIGIRIDGGIAIVQDSEVVSYQSTAVRGGLMYHAGSTFVGDVNADARFMRNYLYMDAESLRVGGTMDISAGLGFSGGLLFYSLEPPSMLDAGGLGVLMTGLPLRVIPVSSTWRGGYGIPDNDLFLGIPLYFQLLSFSWGELSNLEAGIIGPRK